MELRTARLRLRPYVGADFPTLFRELVLDPAVIRFWHDYGAPGLTNSDKLAMAEDDLEAWIREGIAVGFPTWVLEWAGSVGAGSAGSAGASAGDASSADARVDGRGPAPVDRTTLAPAPGDFVGVAEGFVGVAGIFPPENEWGPEPEVGYMLASRHHGRGLATEAVRAVLGDATRRLGIAVLVAIVDEPNVASIRVLEKCGFAFERRYPGRDRHPYRRYVHRTY